MWYHLHDSHMERPSLTHIVERIDALPPSAPAFAVFDFDNTCIVNDITEATFAYMCEQGLIRNKTLLEEVADAQYMEKVFQRYYALLGEGKIKEAYIYISRAYADYSYAELSEMVRKVVLFETENISTRMLFGVEIASGLKARDGISELFAALTERGITLWVVSASPTYFVSPATKIFFPNRELKICGVENGIVDGRVTAEILELPMYEDKVRVIQKKIDPKEKPRMVIGDSKNDLAMLEYAEVPVVIDRGNSLAALAKERNWILF